MTSRVMQGKCDVKQCLRLDVQVSFDPLGQYLACMSDGDGSRLCAMLYEVPEELRGPWRQARCDLQEKWPSARSPQKETSLEVVGCECAKGTLCVPLGYVLRRYGHVG